jgi:hypothetical protein
MRVSTIPSDQNPVSVAQSQVVGEHIRDAVVSGVGLPLIDARRHPESTGLTLPARSKATPYGVPNTFLRGDLSEVQAHQGEVSVPVRIADLWRSADPRDPF